MPDNTSNQQSNQASRTIRTPLPAPATPWSGDTSNSISGGTYAEPLVFGGITQ